jgi:predicted nuclease of predicted toxin-antitoxin system
VRVLFDNNVPAPLRRYLTLHQVSTARQMGWHELENGDLLAAAEAASFEILVTADQNLAYQQNLTGRKLALVVLSTNNWSIIRRAPERVAQAVNAATPGSFGRVEFDPPPRQGSE